MRDNMIHEVHRTELAAKLFQQAKSNTEPSIKPRCANKQQTDRVGIIDMQGESATQQEHTSRYLAKAKIRTNKDAPSQHRHQPPGHPARKQGGLVPIAWG